MINRSLDCYVFDTKQFNNRLKITDDGGFLRWNEARQKHWTVPSPLLQNDRNMPVLKEILAEVFTPERVGKRIKPTLHPMVLVSATSFIERPRHFDTRKVIQADRLKSVIESRGVLKALGSAKQVDSGTLLPARAPPAGDAPPHPDQLPGPLRDGRRRIGPAGGPAGPRQGSPSDGSQGDSTGRSIEGSADAACSATDAQSGSATAGPSGCKQASRHAAFPVGIRSRPRKPPKVPPMPPKGN